MGLLADIFSYGDTQKRRIRGLLDDPVGTLGLGATRAVEDQDGLLNTFANAYPMAGDKTVLNTPAQRKQMQAQAANKALEVYGGLLGATVWHVSPHKFDKFDSRKIGTGVGAQAYGHGLYLAESDKVANEFATMFNKSAPKPASLMRLRDSAPAGSSEWKHYDALLNEGQSNLYKVDLPDEQIAKMLDWDKPLSQQAPEVRKFFEPKVAPMRAEMAKPADGWGDLAAPTKYDPSGQELLGLLRNRDAGNTVQGFLGNGLGRDVSDALRAQGIPGIRYLDGGSRGAGGGTSNFVVFPGGEGLLSILERNGQPIK